MDEYQDTNRVQVEILKALVHSEPCALHLEPLAVRICAIGDPDQAIYGFRGADVRNFYRFEEDFPSVEKMVLTQNYRSTKTILEAASALTTRKTPLMVHETGDVISFAKCRTPAEEAEMLVEQVETLMGGTTYFSLDSGRVASDEEGENISFGDIAVLYRLNIQGDAIEEALSRAGIPFVRSGEKSLVNRSPVNVIWRFLKVLQDPENTFLKKAYLQSLDSAGIQAGPSIREMGPDTTLPDMINRAITLHHLDHVSETEAEDLRRLKEMSSNFKGDPASFQDFLALQRGIDHELLIGDRVALMSLHAAKGLEWPVVFITGCEDKLLPCSLFGDHDEDEEKRLFYVGMTRARQKIILSHTQNRSINHRPLEMNPSPFLDLLPQNLCAPLERSHWKPKKKAHKQLDLFN